MCLSIIPGVLRCLAPLVLLAGMLPRRRGARALHPNMSLRLPKGRFRHRKIPPSGGCPTSRCWVLGCTTLLGCMVVLPPVGLALGRHSRCGIPPTVSLQSVASSSPPTLHKRGLPPIAVVHASRLPFVAAARAGLSSSGLAPVQVATSFLVVSAPDSLARPRVPPDDNEAGPPGSFSLEIITPYPCVWRPHLPCCLQAVRPIHLPGGAPLLPPFLPADHQHLQPVIRRAQEQGETRPLLW